MTSGIEVPASLQRRVLGQPGGRAWLGQLPQQYERCMQRWQLTLDLPLGGSPWSGYTAVVIPVRRRDGTAAALKLTLPHEEARTEADALQLWNGHGAVALLAADKPELALLLQRLDGDSSLMDVPMMQAVRVWGGLVRRLGVDVPAGNPAQFPLLAMQAEQWTDEFPQRWEQLGRPFERWLLEAALQVCQVHGAVGRRRNEDVLVHSDLHYLNILASATNPDEYVAIDPKPVIGDAEFAVAPMLWNRLDELPHRNPEIALLDRLAQLCAAAGLDHELARQWSLVREVDNALWSFDDGVAAEADRSLWVAAAMAGKAYPGLPAVHELPKP